MSIKQIVPGVYAISLGFVNAFLIDADGLILIDTGIPGSAGKIIQAVRTLGKQPADIRHILLTHCHGDHTGSLAMLKAETGAVAYMHPADAVLVRAGQSSRPARPSPGLARFVVPLLESRPTAIEPAVIEHEIQDGDKVAGDLKAIHAPGHTAGHLAFLWPHHGGVLFVGDAGSNMLGLGWGIIYEDLAEGQRSLIRLTTLDFEVACFGHGKTIVGGAAEKFRQKWGTGTR